MERVQYLGIEGVLFHSIGIPDEYVHHGTQDVLRAQYDLHAEGIARRVRDFVRGRVADRPRLATIR
jgi:deoxyxylulose-5-phosphate synthase